MICYILKQARIIQCKARDIVNMSWLSKEGHMVLYF